MEYLSVDPLIHPSYNLSVAIAYLQFCVDNAQVTYELTPHGQLSEAMVPENCDYANPLHQGEARGPKRENLALGPAYIFSANCYERVDSTHQFLLFCDRCFILRGSLEYGFVCTYIGCSVRQSAPRGSGPNSETEANPWRQMNVGCLNAECPTPQPILFQMGQNKAHI